MNSLILSTKKYINVSIRSKQLKKASKLIQERFEKGLATWLEDLTPRVNKRKGTKNNTAERKLASRLVKNSLAEYVPDGIIIPFGCDKTNLDLSLLTKARSVRHRKAITYTIKQFLKMVKPFVTSKQNQWSDLLTHNINATFQVEGLYDKIIKVAPKEMKPTRNKGYMVIIQDPNSQYRKIIFHVYPNRVNLQIGTTNFPVRAADFENVIKVARDYLISITTQFLNLNVEIPSINEWVFTVTHLHHDTINKDYLAYDGNGIEDNEIGIHLYNHIEKNRKCLRLEIKLTEIHLKLKDIPAIFAKNDPFKFLQNHA